MQVVAGRVSLFVSLSALAACGGGSLGRVDAGIDGNLPSESGDDAGERVDASMDVPPPAICPVGLAPGQTDQTGCSPDPTVPVSCSRPAVCVYPEFLGQQIVTVCSG